MNILIYTLIFFVISLTVLGAYMYYMNYKNEQEMTHEEEALILMSLKALENKNIQKLK